MIQANGCEKTLHLFKDILLLIKNVKKYNAKNYKVYYHTYDDNIIELVDLSKLNINLFAIYKNGVLIEDEDDILMLLAEINLKKHLKRKHEH